MFPGEFMHNKTISPLRKVRNTYAAIYSFQDRVPERPLIFCAFAGHVHFYRHRISTHCYQF